MSKLNVTDAGHGGHDSGACSNGYKESNIALEISQLVDKKLERVQGIDNAMTRNSDKYLTLSERSNFANNKKANSFVAIHLNSYKNNKAQGLEIFGYNKHTLELANNILNEFKKKGLYTLLRSSDIAPGIKTANYHVLRYTNMDAALIELGFISNDEDRNLILNNKDKIATCIAKGICAHNGVKYVDNGVDNTHDGTLDKGDYKGRKAIVTASNLNVRWDRGTQFDVIGKLKNGATVDLNWCKDGWVSIYGFNGNKGMGYIHSKYIKLV